MAWRSAAQAHPWVRVDLMHNRNWAAAPAVAEVVVWRVANRLYDQWTDGKGGGFQVTVGDNADSWLANPKCGAPLTYPGAAGIYDRTTLSKAADCGGKAGRYGDWSTDLEAWLCEVEVKRQNAAAPAPVQVDGWYKATAADSGVVPVSAIGEAANLNGDITVSATAALPTVAGPASASSGKAFHFGPTDAIHVSAPTFRANLQCSQTRSAGASGAQTTHSTCNPLSGNYGCCSYQYTSWGRCGNTPSHCECPKCKDQRAYPFDELKASADAHVDKAAADTAFGDAPEMDFGMIKNTADDAASARKRVLFKWDTSAIPAGKKVRRAVFKWYSKYNRIWRWSAHPLSAPWDEKTVTWNNQPAHDASVPLWVHRDYPRNGWGTSNDVRYANEGLYAGARAERAALRAVPHLRARAGRVALRAAPHLRARAERAALQAAPHLRARAGRVALRAAPHLRARAERAALQAAPHH